MRTKDKVDIPLAWFPFTGGVNHKADEKHEEKRPREKRNHQDHRPLDVGIVALEEENEEGAAGRKPNSEYEETDRKLTSLPSFLEDAGPASSYRYRWAPLDSVAVRVGPLSARSRKRREALGLKGLAVTYRLAAKRASHEEGLSDVGTGERMVQEQPNAPVSAAARSAIAPIVPSPPLTVPLEFKYVS